MYKHTQIGWIMIIALAAALAFLLFGSLVSGSVPLIILLVIVAITLILFYRLSVSVTQDYVDVAFGIGLIRKRIKVNEIKSVKPVRNEWWYGFGIHGWWGRGWLYNVSGLEAVELTMNNGMIYRIGTDEPQKLNEVIQPYLNR